MDDALVRLFCEYIGPRVALKNYWTLKEVPNDRFFNDAKFQKAQEVWICANIGLGLEQAGHRVELRGIPDSEQFPDIAMKIDGEKYDFEVTTVYRPDRKMCKEHKDRAKNPHMATPYRPSEGAENGPDWVAAGVKLKVQKNYSASTNLIVYANFEFEELRAGLINDACRKYLDSFDSLWILTERNFCVISDKNCFGVEPLVWHALPDYGELV